MTGVENLFIGFGAIIWDWGSKFSKFIKRRSHRGAYSWAIWYPPFFWHFIQKLWIWLRSMHFRCLIVHSEYANITSYCCLFHVLLTFSYILLSNFFYFIEPSRLGLENICFADLQIHLYQDMHIYIYIYIYINYLATSFTNKTNKALKLKMQKAHLLIPIYFFLSLPELWRYIEKLDVTSK